MKKSNRKMDLLEKLMEMMHDDERGSDEHKYPEKKLKATIMADTEKGLIEGAKKLPEILSKSEEYRKMRSESKDEKKESKESKK